MSAQQALEDHVSGQSNTPLSQPAHALAWPQVARELSTDTDDGLTTSEAKQRLDQHGNNDFGDAAGVSPGKILLRQVASTLR